MILYTTEKGGESLKNFSSSAGLDARYWAGLMIAELRPITVFGEPVESVVLAIMA